MKKVPKEIQKKIFESFSRTELPQIKKNLQRLKNFNKLQFDPEYLLRKALNFSRYNLIPEKQFDYNGAVIFFKRGPKRLKSGRKYIFIMDKLLGKLLKKYDVDIRLLRNQFIKNFADFGFTLALTDFFIRKNIKILEFEPVNPSNEKKMLDLKIQIHKKPVFVEIVSPIESSFKGAKIEEIIKKEVNNHDLWNFGFPLIIVINLADPFWSKNPLSSYMVSDEMFYPISTINYSERGLEFREISVVIIKYGKKLYINNNRNSINGLSEHELEILSKPFFLQRMKQLINDVR